MEQENATREINLRDLWQIFVYRLWMMLLAAVVAVCTFFAFDAITFTPRYSSTATMYILHQESENSSVSDVSSALSTALKVVNDCDFMLKSDTVLNAVKQRLELDDEVFRDLKDNITTKNPSDTRILQVVVEADTPEMAKEIVDALCEIGAENINRAMGFEQVNLYEFGALSTEPCNQTSLLTYALVGGVAAVAVYAVFLFIFLMDDSLKTDEDCQNYLGVSVIGDIPDADDTTKRKYGGYYRGYQREYNRYGYQAKYQHSEQRAERPLALEGKEKVK